MSSGWRVWFPFFVLVALHFLLHLGLGLGRGAPDLLTLALLVAARELRTAPAAASGFALGLLEDAFNVLAFGANTVALTVVGAAGAGARVLFVGDSVRFVVSYLFLGKWLREVIFWLVAGEGLRGPFLTAMGLRAGLAAAYVAALGLLVMWVIGALRESPG